MSDVMRRMIEDRWPRVRAEAQAQTAWMREAIAMNVEGLAGERTEARTVAHQLHGRLGMYGHHHASALAGAMEHLLASSPAPTDAATRSAFARELTALVEQLDQVLANGTHLDAAE